VRNALLVLAVVMVLPRDGLAAPPARVVREAQARFERANRLYNEGRYAEALHLYQAAYDLVPSPDFLFNVGLAKEKTFDWEGCAQAMQQFLREPSSEDQQERARQRLQHCRSRTLIPVKVSSLPSSAAVFVGEGAQRSLRGRTPARLELPPGTYVLTIEAPGYQHQTQKVTAEIGSRPEIDFSLARLSSLRIEADVTGARVQINAEPPEVAPLQRELPAGVYQVRVSKAGHQEVTRRVRVEPGQQVSLVVALPTVPRTLALVSNALAQVSVDGRLVGRTPLAHPTAAGSHRLEAAAPGHVPLVADFVMRDDRDVTARVELRRRPSRWHLVVAGGLLGTAVACGVAATAYGGLALADQHTYKTGVPTRALRDDGRRHAHMADALWIGAASVAAVAVVYYLLTRPRQSRLAVDQ
jgi:hypothetical protein